MRGRTKSDVCCHSKKGASSGSEGGAIDCGDSHGNEDNDEAVRDRACDAAAADRFTLPPTLVLPMSLSPPSLSSLSSSNSLRAAVEKSTAVGAVNATRVGRVRVCACADGGDDNNDKGDPNEFKESTCTESDG
jgi:hypothetical protein